MVTVRQWSGLEARLLRKAMRRSVRGFAEELGIADRTVASWEALGESRVPRPDMQAILDTALALAGSPIQERFQILLHEEGRGSAASAPQTARHAVDHEAWTEDLERAAVALTTQNFALAGELLSRWQPCFALDELDPQGQYLYGRTMTLFGDFHCDQGNLLGPGSAWTAYSHARAVFSQLDVSRRTAQLDLALTIVAEMSGQLDTAARSYRSLAVDERLSARDRGRARLWVGTALSKSGRHAPAISIMTEAARDFDALSEANDWSSAQQKIALAYRGAGDVTSALRYIDLARSTGRGNTLLQRVQLDTATAHVLLSDSATAQDGLATLATAAQVADQYGLGHQLRSIREIRKSVEDPSSREYV